MVYLTGTLSLFTASYRGYHQINFQQKVIETETTETIFFTATQFASLSWMEEGREFTWQNKLYDVKKIVKTPLGYRVYCENDSVEELLLSFLKSLKREMEGGKTNMNLQPQFFEPCQVYLLNKNSFTLPLLYTAIVSHTQSAHLSVASPPPRHFSFLW